jgi:hypothetical protein
MDVDDEQLTVERCGKSVVLRHGWKFSDSYPLVLTHNEAKQVHKALGQWLSTGRI